MEDSSNSGRLEAWSAGLTMFRSQPILGSGTDSLWSITTSRPTILCAVFLRARFRFLGYFFWLALLVVSGLQLAALLRDPEADPVLKRWAFAIQLARTASWAPLCFFRAPTTWDSTF